MEFTINWDISFIISLISLLLTIFFGVKSIFNKTKKEDYELFHVQNANANLINPKFVKIENAVVFYKNNDISNGLFYHKGFIVNTGLKDLKEKYQYSPIKLHIDEDLTIIKVKIVQISDDLIIKPKQTENNTIVFSWEKLFKSNEFFSYEIVAKYNKEPTYFKRKIEYVKIDCRIKNVNKLNTKYLNYFPEYASSIVFPIYLFSLTAIPIIISFIKSEHFFIKLIIGIFSLILFLGFYSLTKESLEMKKVYKKFKIIMPFLNKYELVKLNKYELLPFDE